MRASTDGTSQLSWRCWPKTSTGANGMDGGHVHGREAVRAYWTKQWAAIAPRVDPLHVAQRDDGATAVEVHQIVRDLEGESASRRDRPACFPYRRRPRHAFRHRERRRAVRDRSRLRGGIQKGRLISARTAASIETRRRLSRGPSARLAHSQSRVSMRLKRSQKSSMSGEYSPRRVK